MEKETASPHQDIPYEGDQKDRVMTVSQTVPDTFACKVHEEQVGQRVDNFCGVHGNHIVLCIHQ